MREPDDDGPPDPHELRYGECPVCSTLVREPALPDHFKAHSLWDMARTFFRIGEGWVLLAMAAVAVVAGSAIVLLIYLVSR